MGIALISFVIKGLKVDISSNVKDCYSLDMKRIWTQIHFSQSGSFRVDQNFKCQLLTAVITRRGSWHKCQHQNSSTDYARLRHKLGSMFNHRLQKFLKSSYFMNRIGPKHNRQMIASSDTKRNIVKEDGERI